MNLTALSWAAAFGLAAWYAVILALVEVLS